MQARSTLAALCVPLLGLSACMAPQPTITAGSKLPTYSTDLQGKAANCVVAPVTLADGKTVAATMTTGGGGWCGVLVRRNDQPLGAGLLTQAAKGGAVYVHTVGDDTRVDYTPRPGTSGADSFTVKFIPGDAVLTVAVTVDQPPAAATPAPEPAKPASTTHSRPTTTSTRARK